MATFPWTLNPGRKERKPGDFPNVMRWVGDIEERPAVKVAMQVPAEEKRDLAKGMDEETRGNLFGAAQYRNR